MEVPTLRTRTLLATLDRRGYPIEPAALHKWLHYAPSFPGAQAAHWTGGSAGLVQRVWRAGPEAFQASEPKVEGAFVLVSDLRLDEREALGNALGISDKQCAEATDEDLVLLAHHRWGVDAPAHLRGAFAYALYDHRCGSLQIARDAMGEKPLLYYEDAARVMVSSVLAPILSHPAVPERIDPHGVACLLTAAPGEQDWTLFEGVRHVRPGETLVFGRQRTERRLFWNPALDQAIRYRSMEEYATHFRLLLDTSLRDRLRSQERAALSMSGGLDSTTIAASASEMALPLGRSPLHAISYVFDELAACDERRYIDPVVSKYELPNTQILGDNLWTLKQEPPWPSHPFHVQLDPFAHLPRAVWQTCTELNCTTLLIGSMGDALFDGGRYWLSDQLSGLRWSRTARILRQPEVRMSWKRGVWPYGVRPLIPRRALRAARRLFRRPNTPFHDGLSDQLQAGLAEGAVDLATYGAPPPIPGRLSERVRDLSLRAASGYTAAIRHEIEPMGLDIVDPFHDRRLVEFVLRIPADVLAEPPWTKRLLREAMRGRLPEPVRMRPDKSSLVPLLRRGLLDREQALARELAKCQSLVQRGFVRPEWIAEQERQDPSWFVAHWRGWRMLSLEQFLTNRT